MRRVLAQRNGFVSQASSTDVFVGVDSIYCELAPADHARVSALCVSELSAEAFLDRLNGMDHRHPALMLKALWQLLAHFNVVTPVVVEDCALAEGTVLVSELEDLDAHFLVEGETHWEVLLAANPAEDCFLKTHIVRFKFEIIDNRQC